MVRHGRLLVIVVVLTMLGLSSGTARADIYWSSIGNDSVGKANYDGSGANFSLIKDSGPAAHIAVNSRWLYWTVPGSPRGSIGRARLDGSDPNENFLTALDGPQGIAADEHYIYWVNQDGGSISRANEDGSDVVPQFIRTTGPRSWGIALTSEAIFWTNVDAGFVGRADLDGTKVNNEFLAVPKPTEIAANLSHVYVYDSTANQIKRAPSNGTAPFQPLVNPTGPLGGLAVDQQYLYWSNVTSGTIGRSHWSGSDVEQSFISASPNAVPTGVAAKAPQQIYFDPEARMPLNSSPMQLRAVAAVSPVMFTSHTPSVCTIAGTTAVLHRIGICTITASQDGNRSFEAAPAVMQSINVVANPTELTVKARVHRHRLDLRDRTTVVRRATSNGRITQVSSFCYLNGDRLDAKEGRRLCGLSERGSQRSGAHVSAKVRCTSGVKVRVRISARNPGAKKTTWSRNWRATASPSVPCRR